MGYRERLIAFFIIDLCIISFSVWLSYMLRFDGSIPKSFAVNIPYVIGLSCVITYPMLRVFKLYSRVWQYASIGELVSVIRAVSFAVIAIGVVYYCMKSFGISFKIPRSIFLLIWITMIVGIGGSRFVWRVLRDNYNYAKMQAHKKKVLIIGAGSAGALVVKELKSFANSDLFIVGFIDDDEMKHRLNVMGIPVLGGRERIAELVKANKVDKIIIAMPSAPREEIAKIINLCKETGAQLKILPLVSDVIRGKVSVNMIRDVHVEDLLGREPVEVDLKGIADYVTNQTVLVTGAGGSIGSELCRQIAPFFPKVLLLLGHGENSIYTIEMELRKTYPQLAIVSIIADIQDERRMNSVFATYRPSVVFHAAAHKHVPLMELNPTEAIKNNVHGTRIVAECAHQYGAAHFVMISTDKAVNPTNVMGATKRIAEMIIQSLNRYSDTKFVAVRFGNVLGSRGSVIPLFKQQIAEGGPVTVTHPDMVRYFMTIPEAVQLVIQAGALAKGGEVFILDMGKPINISELAHDLIRMSGLEPEKDIKIRYTGIRPGEKLFEELLTAEEGTTSTKHNRIFIGKPAEFSLEAVRAIIEKLEQLTKAETAVEAEEIKIVLHQIVPTYQLESTVSVGEEQYSNEKDFRNVSKDLLVVND